MAGQMPGQAPGPGPYFQQPAAAAVEKPKPEAKLSKMSEQELAALVAKQMGDAATEAKTDLDTSDMDISKVILFYKRSLSWCTMEDCIYWL